MSDESFDPLEKKLHAVLRRQPALRAPSSLEVRVRAGIERRAARPWWQRSFAEWPLVARAAFVALSACAACISVAGTLALVEGPGAQQAAAVLEEFHGLRLMIQWLADAVARLAGTIPPGGWYVAGAVLAAVYLALLGIGATAYQWLWKSR